jgi:hypothetical protein
VTVGFVVDKRIFLLERKDWGAIITWPNIITPRTTDHWSILRPTWSSETIIAPPGQAQPPLPYLVSPNHHCSTWPALTTAAPPGQLWPSLSHLVSPGDHCSSWSAETIIAPPDQPQPIPHLVSPDHQCSSMSDWLYMQELDPSLYFSKTTHLPRLMKTNSFYVSNILWLSKKSYVFRLKLEQANL